MGHLTWITSIASLGIIAAVCFGTRWLRNQRRHQTLCQARKQFRRRREWLEVDFLESASQCGKPRGLSWADCEFDDGVAFARDRGNGELRALVGATIRFEPIAGDELEELIETGGNRRVATVVFRYEGGRWQTDGRAIFNLDPIETIRHFQHELERVSS